MDLRGVLDDDHELALGPAEAEFGDRSGAVREEALLIGPVRPGPGHHLRAVHRAEVVLELLHDLVKRFGVDDPLFDKDRFDRGDPRLDRRHLGGVMMASRHFGSSR